MKKTVLFAACLAGFAPHAEAGDRYGTYVTRGHTVTVSCFRGPWREVIWDRPEPVFIDSLVAAGYDFPTAHAMAERICRDRSTVGNREALRSTAQGIVDSYPPTVRHAAPAPVYRAPAPAPVYRAPAATHGHRAPMMHSTPNGQVYVYGQ